MAVEHDDSERAGFCVPKVDIVVDLFLSTLLHCTVVAHYNRTPNVGRAAILRAGWLASRSALWSAYTIRPPCARSSRAGGIDVLAMGIDDCRVTDVNQQDAPQHQAEIAERNLLHEAAFH